MKRSLAFKLVLCYIIAIFTIFTLTNTLGRYLFNKELEKKYLNNITFITNTMLENETIYDFLINTNSTNAKNDDITDNDNIKKSKSNTKKNNSTIKTVTSSNNKLQNYLENYFNIITQTSGTNIWLFDKDGNFLYYSNNKKKNTKVISKNINDYYPRFLYLNTIDNFYIKGLTNSKSLCKITKIKSNDSEIIGYLTLSYPKNNISNEYASLMTMINIIIGGICFIVLIIFILIYFLTINPIHKITKYAIETSQGNMNSSLIIRSNDEYRDLANAINYLSNELNNLDEYQRKFISNISHDFRSPLTSIKGYLEAMLDGTIPPQSYNKFIKIILFEADRLTNLTTNLLTLNKLDGQKQLLDKTNFDINDIISKTIEVYEGRCAKHKIKLEKNFENIHQYVYADQSKIQQVINNLLDNAIKFSPNNSTIILSTYVRSEKIFVSIKDHGAGIPKKYISHIWERFYKIDTSRGKDKRGTGLGLSITKEIINAHHENINVTSTEGVGTEFSFSLQKSSN